MSKRLDGKIAVITGGSAGIGLATAQRFVEEGAKVVLFGRKKEALDDAVSQLGGEEVCTAVQGDVSKVSDLEQLFSTVKETHGRVDVLFANAGVATPGSVEEETEDNFDFLFNVNVKGTFFTIQKALPLMPKGSSIILTTSCSGSKGEAGLSVYAATKAALRSLVRSLSAELMPTKGIRVNAVSPGMTATRIHAETDQESVSAYVPMGRFAEPKEIADPVVFLASDESSYMLGAELAVDGGVAQI